jgi:hypothetical protein
VGGAIVGSGYFWVLLGVSELSGRDWKRSGRECCFGVLEVCE